MSSSSYLNSISSESSFEISTSNDSFLDYHSNRLLPFFVQSNIDKSVRAIAETNSQIFVGTNENGTVLRSKDRYFWEDYYKTEEPIVSSVFVSNNILYVGTSPYGKVFRINLATDSLIGTYSLTGNIIAFFKIATDMYAVSSSPANVYKFDIINNKWNSIYQPYNPIINQVKLLNGIVYFTLGDNNLLSFDGDIWNIVTNITNITNLSVRDFSSTYYQFSNAGNYMDIVPYHKPKGINSIIYHNSNILLGSNNDGIIYWLNDKKKAKILWQTQGDKVNDLLSLDDKAFLASIDNRVFLVSTIETKVVEDDYSSDSSGSVIENKNFIIDSPYAGQYVQLGTTFTITWQSTKGYNDAIKLSLYKDGKENLVISSQTVNTGSYDWDVPISIEEGSNYQIYIEWLSSGKLLPENQALSGMFSIAIEVVESSSFSSTIDVTQNTTTDLSTVNYKGIPVLSLPNGEIVTSMVLDNFEGVLFGTSFGRILSCSKLHFNAFLTGTRNLYANVWNGYNDRSETAIGTVLYALYNRVAEISEESEIVNQKYISNSSISTTEKIEAYFISQPFYIKEDIAFWNELIWDEVKSADTNISVFIKTAKSESALQSTPWKYGFRSSPLESGTIVRKLNNCDFNGQYFQIMIKLNSVVSISNPIVSRVSVSYATKNAYYFYTTKFSLSNNSDVKNGLLTATMTTPINTEVKFGMANKNTADWNDFDQIPTNKLFAINDFKNIKIGIQLVSYDGNLPSVNDFGLMVGNESKEKITI